MNTTFPQPSSIAETPHLGFQVPIPDHTRIHMKTAFNCLLAALFLIPALAAAEFKIDWSSFGGPAGESTGGGWTASSAAGNGAGTARGGSFALTGGYWSVIGIVSAPGAPRLIIERSGASVRVSWPRSAEAFTLQETKSLTGSPEIPWTTSTDARETNATQFTVSVPITAGSHYFRLHKP